MMRLPKLIASSVIRGAQLGQSYGGVYLVDPDRGCVELKRDWNRTDIDVMWFVRGASTPGSRLAGVRSGSGTTGPQP